MKEMKPRINQGEAHAQRAFDAQAAEYDAMISEREHELAQAADEAAYFATRPQRENSGSLRSPKTGKFASEKEYHKGFHQVRQEQMYEETQQTPYEDMGIVELAKKLGEAEYHDDLTTQENITDVLLDKLAEHAGDMASAEEFNRHKGGKDTPDVRRPDAEEMSANPEDALWDRVMRVKDKAKADLVEQDTTKDVDDSQGAVHGPSKLELIRGRNRARRSNWVEETNHEGHLLAQLARAQVEGDSYLENKIIEKLDSVVEDIKSEFPDATEDQIVSILSKQHADVIKSVTGEDVDVPRGDVRQEPEPTPEPETLEQPLSAEAAAREFFDTEAGQELSQDMGRALDAYATLLAKYETKHFRGKDEQKVETARKTYEALRRKALFSLADNLKEFGFDDEQIKKELQRQQYHEIGNEQSSQVTGGDVGLVEHVTRIEAERLLKEKGFTSRLANLWAKKGFRGVLGKAGIMMPVSVAAAGVGVLAAPVIGAGAGAAAAVFVTNRIAKGFMRAKISAKANAATRAREAASQRSAKQRALLEYASADQPRGDDGISRDVTSAFSGGAEDTIRRNKVRAGVGVGFALAGGVAGGILQDALEGSVPNNMPRKPSGLRNIERAKNASGHFERTRGGELFELGGAPDDGSRLQIVHDELSSSKTVSLRSADGAVSLDNLQLGSRGLTPESVARVRDAGYEVRFNPAADAGRGRLEIFRPEDLLEEDEE